MLLYRSVPTFFPMFTHIPLEDDCFLLGWRNLAGANLVGFRECNLKILKVIDTSWCSGAPSKPEIQLPLRQQGRFPWRPAYFPDSSEKDWIKQPGSSEWPVWYSFTRDLFKGENVASIWIHSGYQRVTCKNLEDETKCPIILKENETLLLNTHSWESEWTKKQV